jgi:hypothetical protein
MMTVLILKRAVQGINATFCNIFFEKIKTCSCSCLLMQVCLERDNLSWLPAAPLYSLQPSHLTAPFFFAPVR